MSVATLPQASKLLELLGQKKVSAETFQALLEKGLLADLFECDPARVDRAALGVALGQERITRTLTPLEATIPKKMSIEQMILAGKYDNVMNMPEAFPHSLEGKYLTSARFTIAHRGERKLHLLHIGKRVNSEVVKAMAEMEKKRLARAEDGLALGLHSKHRDLQRQFPIVCLGAGTKVDERHGLCVAPPFWGVLRLMGRANCRQLDMTRIDQVWEDHTRFLLVDSTDEDPEYVLSPTA